MNMRNVLTKMKHSMAAMLWIMLKWGARHTKMSTHPVNRPVLIVYTIRTLTTESVLRAM